MQLLAPISTLFPIFTFRSCFKLVKLTSTKPLDFSNSICWAVSYMVHWSLEHLLGAFLPCSHYHPRKIQNLKKKKNPWNFKFFDTTLDICNFECLTVVLWINVPSISSGYVLHSLTILTYTDSAMDNAWTTYCTISKWNIIPTKKHYPIRNQTISAYISKLQRAAITQSLNIGQLKL